jgi:aspartate aminotransferase
MKHVSKRVKELSESQTLLMAAKSRELQENGVDVINLSIGEPDFDTPEFIRKAAKKAIDDNITHYTPVPGFPELREAIAKKLKRDNKLDYSAGNVVVSTGAKQSLMNVVLSVINPGEELILPAPYWVSYYAMGEFAQASIKTIKTTVESEFKITGDQLEKSITSKSRLLIFSSPCNPSGSVYSEEELSDLVRVIQKHPNLVVVSDEIYEHINYSGSHASLARFEEIKEQVVTVNGVSKGFAMTGWRIGYIAAPEWIAKAAIKVQGQFTSGANSIAQMAAKAAVEASPDSVSYMNEAFLKRRELILDLIKDIDGLKTATPQGAFYVFPDVSHFFGKDTPEGKVIAHSTDLCMYLLNEVAVATVPGEAFGDENCIRLSYATSENNIRLAIERIKTALDKLK